jgi:glutamate/aspartate transport system permease protein
MNYHWDWGVLFRSPFFGWILSGFALTCLISLLAWILALLIGSVVGVGRTLDNRAVRALGTLYVEVFRSIPLLVQFFLWYYVLPQVLPTAWGTFLKRGLPNAQFWTVVVGLGLYTAARVAEQVRSGIGAIPRGQSSAALAVGFTRLQMYRYVLLPVAYRMLVPSLTSEFLGVFKNSSLALTLGVLELTAQTRQIEDYTFQAFEAFTAATVLYALVSFIVMGLMRMIEGRSRIVGTMAVGAA